MAKLNKYVLLLGIAVYIIVGVVAINTVTSWVTQEYYTMLGTKALDIAKIAAEKFEITDQEVAELRELNFRETLNHPANQRLTQLFTEPGFSRDFKYAYLMVELTADEIKYYVTEETADYFEAEVGKPLDLLWLLDVIVNREEQVEVAAEADYYDDIHRYSYLRDTDIPYFKERKSGYIIVDDEYGNSFTGMVPIYTVEGNFVGLMGVDIYYERFITHSAEVRNSLILVFFLPSVILTILYIFIHFKSKSASNREINTDPLTALYNRRYLEKILPKLLRNCSNKNRPLAAIMADIDFFKNYNDNYGHKKGDEVIISVANAIVSVLRNKIDIVCRYGGEEIFILLPDTDEGGALLVAERIKQSIKALKIDHDFSAVSRFITISQGIYVAIPGGASKTVEAEYIEHADKALYDAKQSGRNRYQVYR